jgi:molybdopterin-containing oxidoreductase family membrane subunit
MATKKYVMGLFRDEDRAAAVVKGLEDTPWSLLRVHSPVPSHKISAALKLKKSVVGWFTLIGGIIGFLSGFGLAIYTAVEWNLIVSGKPVVALVPFVIVGFEFTVLFAIFGNVIGMISQARLPRFDESKYYDARCSGEHFGILAACEENDQESLLTFFRNNGGEVKAFD